MVYIITEYHAAREGFHVDIDSGGNVSDLALAHNCCLARMLPGEAELVLE